MKLRAGEAWDWSGIVALEYAAFGPDAWTEAQVSAELGAPAHAVVVADVDGVLVGFGCISEAGDVADLLRIAVAPDARRSGVASALLRALREQVRAADRMLLEVGASNLGAQAFYAAHGFTEIARRRRYYGNCEDALILSAPLP